MASRLLTAITHAGSWREVRALGLSNVPLLGGTILAALNLSSRGCIHSWRVQLELLESKVMEVPTAKVYILK